MTESENGKLSEGLSGTAGCSERESEGVLDDWNWMAVGL